MVANGWIGSARPLDTPRRSGRITWESHPALYKAVEVPRYAAITLETRSWHAVCAPEMRDMHLFR
jgi:hypothetical protein